MADEKDEGNARVPGKFPGIAGFMKRYGLLEPARGDTKAAKKFLPDLLSVLIHTAITQGDVNEKPATPEDTEDTIVITQTPVPPIPPASIHMPGHGRVEDLKEMLDDAIFYDTETAGLDVRVPTPVDREAFMRRHDLKPTAQPEKQMIKSSTGRAMAHSALTDVHLTSAMSDGIKAFDLLATRHIPSAERILLQREIPASLPTQRETLEAQRKARQRRNCEG